MSRDIRRTRTGKPVKAMAACGLMCVWMIGAAMTGPGLRRPGYAHGLSGTGSQSRGQCYLQH